MIGEHNQKKGDNSDRSPDFRCVSSEKEVSLFFDYNERFERYDLTYPLLFRFHHPGRRF